jgi:PKD repeat protein
MIKQRLFRFALPGSLFMCMALAAALLFLMGAPPEAGAQCACNDGTCDNVGRAYYTFGETVNESCQFTADITRPSGKNSYGFLVTGSGITIDGTGHCLDGVSTDSPVIVGANGIYLSGFGGASNVTIKNLEVKNFWQGIKASGTNEANPITGIVIDNCTVHDNGVSGHDAKYEGIWFDLAQNSEIKNCRIYNNRQGSGIGNGSGDYNYFHDNEVYGNFKYGIKAWWTSEHIRTEYNSFHNNNYGGIAHTSQDANYGSIKYNTCTNNTGQGILVGGTGSDVWANVSTGNVDGTEIDPSTGEPYEEGHGIVISGATGSTVTVLNNTACGNATNRYDIEVADGMVVSSASGNTCNTTSNFNDTGYAGCTSACASGFPVARFYGTPTQACAGTAVQFYDQSLCGAGGTLAWDWDFGDGTTHDALQNPSHAYDGGVYSVTLSVTMTGGGGGTDSVTKTDYITVCPYPGDFEPDTDVDGSDFYFFYTNCIAGGPAGWCDINGDGNINGYDMKHFGLMDCLSCS